jgi:hypothetical protein
MKKKSPPKECEAPWQGTTHKKQKKPPSRSFKLLGDGEVC